MDVNSERTPKHRNIEINVRGVMQKDMTKTEIHKEETQDRRTWIIKVDMSTPNREKA